MKSIIIRGILGLILIWGLAFGLIRIFRGSKPTAQRIAESVADTHPDNLNVIERKRALDRYIHQVKRLPYNERVKLHSDARVRQYFDALKSDEQLRVFEETLPSGLNEIMNAFNEMEENERRKFVERAQKSIDKIERDLREQGRNPRHQNEEHTREMLERLSREGLRAYLRDADAQSKIELQPLLEQMQAMMQRIHR